MNDHIRFLYANQNWPSLDIQTEDSAIQEEGLSVKKCLTFDNMASPGSTTHNSTAQFQQHLDSPPSVPTKIDHQLTVPFQSTHPHHLDEQRPFGSHPQQSGFSGMQNSAGQQYGSTPFPPAHLHHPNQQHTYASQRQQSGVSAMQNTAGQQNGSMPFPPAHSNHPNEQHPYASQPQQSGVSATQNSAGQLHGSFPDRTYTSM